MINKPWLKVLGVLLAPLLVLAHCATAISPVTVSEGGSLPPADSSSVTSIEIFPSAARVVNGSEIVFTVVTRIGAAEVLATFSPAVDDSSVATILSANQTERTVLVKARGPGDAELTVHSGNVQAQASITVLPATP